MTPKAKAIIWGTLWGWRNYRARATSRKIKKLGTERYSDQFRNDFVLKRAKQMLKLLNVELEIIGYENVPKNPTLITPNHQSSLDPLVILAALENPEKGGDNVNHKVVFIAKQELKKQKRTRGYMDVLNTFYIDRKNPRQALEVFDELVEHAKQTKKHIIIFPEGTRSNDGQLLEFHGGSFKIAKKAFVPIVPVTINNTLSATDLSRKGKLKVQVIFHPVIKPMSVVTSDTTAIANQVQKIVKSKLTKPEGKRSALDKKVA